MASSSFENENTVFRVIQEGKAQEWDREYETAFAEARKRVGATYPMLIGGKEVTSQATFETRDPSTGDVVARFPKGTVRDVGSAVAAAKAAQPAWERLGWEKRAAIVEKAADIMRARRPELAAIMTIENGKNRVESYYDVDEAIDFLKMYALQMREHKGFVIELGHPFPDEKCVSVMRPWGVFAVIGPFNFPVAIPTGMAVAALLTGNTVVLKPASDTPWLAFEVVKILHDAGVPKDALNFVTGGGREVGQPLIDHDDVDGLVFTGSREVGMKNFKQFVGKRPRPYIAEMGGKNAVIVTENADLDKAVPGLVKSAFGFSGQKCSAASRCYVHESKAEEFTRRVVDEAKKLVVALPWQKEADMGPIINAKAVDTYVAAVEAAKKAGGRVLLGGERLAAGDLAKGHFVAPTIVTGLPDDHEAFRTEYFVPFVAITTYTDFDHVMKEVNAVDYGLTGGIFSEDEAEIQEYFQRAEIGVVYANRARGGSTGAMVGGQSFGGWKFSGTTGRGAGGPWYLTQFMREQSRTYASSIWP